MNVQRGMRDRLEKYVDPQRNLDILMDTAGGAVYDYCCFGVDAVGSSELYSRLLNEFPQWLREIRRRGMI